MDFLLRKDVNRANPYAWVLTRLTRTHRNSHPRVAKIRAEEISKRKKV